MLKHTINHSYKFDNYFIVCLSALAQLVVAFLCEILNYMYIITTDDTMNIVGQFIAFYIIADLDTIYYKVIAPTSIRTQLNEEMSDMLTRRHITTSVDAKMIIQENLLTDERLGVPRNVFGDAFIPEFIRYNFRQRPWHNKLLFLIYRLIKGFHTSFWYYFAPFYMLYSFFSIWR